MAEERTESYEPPTGLVYKIGNDDCPAVCVLVRRDNTDYYLSSFISGGWRNTRQEFGRKDIIKFLKKGTWQLLTKLEFDNAKNLYESGKQRPFPLEKLVRTTPKLEKIISESNFDGT